jgi:hippurate hydrolase
MQGTREKSGGSEDFAYIANEVPSVMIGLCAGDIDKGYTLPLHHPKVDFDESVLWQGALAFAVCALTK